MNMEQLFKALPRDLQWEILSDFVGTHVVRNGKLIQKMTGEIQEELASKMSGELWLKEIPINVPLGTWIAYDGICFNTELLLIHTNNMDIYLYENSNREMNYKYVTSTQSVFTSPMKDTHILQPYIKHTYTSYPYTNKKLGRPSNKVTLYNPK